MTSIRKQSHTKAPRSFYSVRCQIKKPVFVLKKKIKEAKGDSDSVGAFKVTHYWCDGHLSLMGNPYLKKVVLYSLKPYFLYLLARF